MNTAVIGTSRHKPEYWQTYYAKPGVAERRRRLQRERYRRHSAVLAQLKDVPCADCGGHFHHCQMEFDHKVGSVKELAIGRMKKDNLERLIKETAKCDVVCANCHAMRTWKRWQEDLDGD